jgi:hypothetical protein
MTSNAPTCVTTVGFHADGEEIQCGQLATHAVANTTDGVVVYRCDRHRLNQRCDELIPYCTLVTLEEAILIEVLGE